MSSCLKTCLSLLTCKFYYELNRTLIEPNLFSIQSILISRFLLNLRSIYTTGSGSDPENTISTVKSVSFANIIVGNLGAPLRNSIYGSSNHDEDEGEIYVTSDPLLAGLDIENMEEYPDLENVSVIDIRADGPYDLDRYVKIYSTSFLVADRIRTILTLFVSAYDLTLVTARAAHRPLAKNIDVFP